MNSPFDPENMYKMSSRERARRFVPLEEVPDDKPDPSQALIEKEEGVANKDKKKPETKKVDVNDLSRPPQYDEEEFNDEVIVVPPLPSDISDKHEEVVSEVERSVLREKAPPPKWDASLSESHGKRGKKPIYKDKRGSTLDK